MTSYNMCRLEKRATFIKPYNPSNNNKIAYVPITHCLCNEGGDTTTNIHHN